MWFSHDEGIHCTAKVLFYTTKEIHGCWRGHWDKVVNTKTPAKLAEPCFFHAINKGVFYTREVFSTRRIRRYTEFDRKHEDRVTKRNCLYNVENPDRFSHEGSFFHARKKLHRCPRAARGCIIVVNKIVCCSDKTREVAPTTIKKSGRSFGASVRGTLGSIRRIAS